MIRKPMTLALLGAVASLLFAVSSEAAKINFKKFKGSIGVHAGYFGYLGDEDFWDNLETNFDTKVGDFNDLSYGIEVTIPINSIFDFAFGVEYMRSKQTLASKVFFDVNGDGSDIIKDFENEAQLELIPINVLGLRYFPLKKERWFAPFIGLQVSVLYWKYKESGTFVFPDYRGLDENPGTATSEVPDYLAVRDQTDHDDFDLSINFEIGVEFMPVDHFVIAWKARYMMSQDQVSREFSYFAQKPGADRIQDVFVTNIFDFETINLNNWETGITLFWKVR